MGDDCEVQFGDQTFYPHVGESVDFKGRPSFGLFLELADITNNPDVMGKLASGIAGWDFTDDNGQPYENPPTAETLKLLPNAEVGWLIKKATAAAITEEAMGEEPTLST